MRKNKMMRLASALLVAVLLSTCAISGTFAKYVTAETASDSARVANWGVAIVASGETFAAKYNDAADDAGTKVVSTVDVLAPGTNGSLANVSVTGIPEVMVSVTYSADLVLTGWALADSSVYCPIVFTVNGTEYKIDGTYTTTADLEAAIEGAINAITNTYAAGTDLSTVVNDDLSVTWAWAYNGGHDSEDTYLGNQASIGNAPTISLTITTTITQVD